MTGIHVEIVSDDLVRLTGDMIERTRDLREPFADFGEYMVRETWERFDREAAPDGTPWAPLSARTLARKRIPKILTETSNLKDRITYQAERARLVIGTNVIYAAIHQFGGKAGKNHAAEIPARPYLGVNDADLEELQEILKDWITG